MAYYDSEELADFLTSHDWHAAVPIEYQQRGAIAEHFGCTLLTAAKWVDRIKSEGIVEVMPGGWGYCYA